MKYRALGRTGLNVSEIGHGLWGMGDWSGSNDRESLDALHASFDRGCTFYDSAWSYGKGKSDELLGQLAAAIRPRRLVAAGKIPPKISDRRVSSSDRLSDVYPLDHVLKYAEDSLRKAALERFDLMQLHVWDDAWARDPLFETLVSELKARGLCDGFGISLARGQPDNGLEAVRTGLVDTVQVVYNLFDQAAEDHLFPLCAARGVGVIARVPLDEGSLGGNMTIETRFPPEDWRSTYFKPANLGQTLARVAELRRVIPVDETLPGIALRFILHNPAVSTVIVGMRRSGHIEKNLGMSDKPPLDDSLMSALRKHRWDRSFVS